jgi:hypothetical protein
LTKLSQIHQDGKPKQFSTYDLKLIANQGNLALNNNVIKNKDTPVFKHNLLFG